MLERHMPAACIYDQFNSAKVEALCATQRASAKKGKLRNIVVILDDLAADKRVVKSPAVRDIYMNGRHQVCHGRDSPRNVSMTPAQPLPQHITYISTMQYVMDMGPDLRANVDYVFTLKVKIICPGPGGILSDSPTFLQPGQYSCK